MLGSSTASRSSSRPRGIFAWHPPKMVGTQVRILLAEVLSKCGQPSQLRQIRGDPQYTKDSTELKSISSVLFLDVKLQAKFIRGIRVVREFVSPLG